MTGSTNLVPQVFLLLLATASAFQPLGSSSHWVSIAPCLRPVCSSFASPDRLATWRFQRHLKGSRLPTVAMIDGDTADLVAVGLGYLVGAGSLLLYTPIAVRVVRQGNADGLTLSTWWLKLASYLCSDVYAVSNGYPIASFSETLVITAEAAIVLGIVAFYQKKTDSGFVLLGTAYAVATVAALDFAPPELLGVGQAGATLLNTGALLPQLIQNAQRRSPGDFSAVTAALACTGCLIRLFTTVRLAGSDPLLLGSYGFAFFLNASLLTQIYFYGVIQNGQSFWGLMSSDFRAAQPVARVDGWDMAELPTAEQVEARSFSETSSQGSKGREQ